MQHVYIHRVYTPCIYTVRAHTCKHRDEEVTPSEWGPEMVHFGGVYLELEVGSGVWGPEMVHFGTMSGTLFPLRGRCIHL